VQLAAYHAICNLIPSLDPKLLDLANALSPGKEITEDSHAASSRFCPNCGKTTGATDKFCTHCGERMPK
jgi:NADH pyrophosphatase NudC (nudix superfamily)